MKLEYRAYDKAGRLVCDVLDATTVAEAADVLRQRNLLVSEVAPAAQAQAHSGRFRLPQGRIRKLRELAMFTRQLHSLVQSGTPLTQGLSALERQARAPQWKQVISDLRSRIERGGTLTDAMRAHPNYFDSVYTNMVSAGEASGKLTELLDRLASLTRRQVHVLGMIRGAMVYPILLGCVGAIVMGVLLLFVVPRFASLFTELGAPLPPTTAFLIACSDGLKNYWYAVAGAVAGAVFGIRYLLRTPGGKRFWDTTVLRIPQIGAIVRSFATARIARVLGLLVNSYLPIQDSLRLTRGTVSNTCYGELLDKAQQAVARGDAISSAFRDSRLITPAIYEALHSGERTGRVGAMLVELADFLDEENEISLKTLTSIIEPVMLVLMAVMVGFVAMSIFLPLFDVTALVSGGEG